MKKYFVVQAEQVIEFEYCIVADTLEEAKQIAKETAIDFDSPCTKFIQTTGDISAWGKPRVTDIEEQLGTWRKSDHTGTRYR